MQLSNHFGLKTYFSSVSSLKRKIKVIEVDRPGLEMTGFFEYHQKSRLVLIGKKEIAYLDHMEHSQALKVLEQICSEETPGLIVCHDMPCPPVILEAAKKKDCAVFGTEIETSAFEADALNYLSEQLAPTTSLHGNLLEIFGEGVLLLGASGIGKSEVCLDLIKRGHTLVADDKVDIRNVRNHLEGTSPEVIYGMMEVRGIGIINVPRMFGINALTNKTTIRYCINLVPFSASLPVDRIGNSTDQTTILDIKIPCVTLPVSPGRSMAEVIEVAVTNFKLKAYGYDSAYQFEKKLEEFRSAVPTLNKEKEKK
jgi:HPr kinase/phosphorylase